MLEAANNKGVVDGYGARVTRIASSYFASNMLDRMAKRRGKRIEMWSRRKQHEEWEVRVRRTPAECVGAWSQFVGECVSNMCVTQPSAISLANITTRTPRNSLTIREWKIGILLGKTSSLVRLIFVGRRISGISFSSARRMQ